MKRNSSARAIYHSVFLSEHSNLSRRKNLHYHQQQLPAKQREHIRKRELTFQTTRLRRSLFADFHVSRAFQTIFARLYFRAASNSDRHVSKCQQILKASVINRTRASLFSRNNVLAFHAGNISTLKCIEYRILNVSTSSEIRVVNKTDKLAKCSHDSKQKHLTSMSG